MNGVENEPFHSVLRALCDLRGEHSGLGARARASRNAPSVTCYLGEAVHNRKVSISVGPEGSKRAAGCLAVRAG